MDPLRRKKKYLDSYARYSSIAIQMLVIILVGVFGGLKLDQWLKLNAPVFTVILSVASVALAIYYVTRGLLKSGKNDHDEEMKDQ